MWIQIEGSPRPIELDTSELSHVDSLLKKVKEEVAPRLDKVPVDSLQLFLNRATTQAFEPDVLVSNLTGGSNPKEALYVKPVTLEQAVGMGVDTALGPPMLLHTDLAHVSWALTCCFANDTHADCWDVRASTRTDLPQISQNFDLLRES